MNNENDDTSTIISFPTKRRQIRMSKDFWHVTEMAMRGLAVGFLLGLTVLAWVLVGAVFAAALR